MLEIGWGICLRSGRVVSAASRRPAICPCCRCTLTHAGTGYRHPAGDCTTAAIEQALAWRIAMARFSAGRPPQLQEHCVTCGEHAGSPRTLGGGGPAGHGAVWVAAGLTLRLGGARPPHPAEIRVRPREVLTNESSCWDAVARRKCPPCAHAQAQLDAADGAHLHAVALRSAEAQRSQGQARARDRAAARWGLTAAWGPYQVEPRDCAACGSAVVAYRWAGAQPPAPRPRVVAADGGQRCAACGESLR